MVLKPHSYVEVGYEKISLGIYFQLCANVFLTTLFGELQ